MKKVDGSVYLMYVSRPAASGCIVTGGAIHMHRSLNTRVLNLTSNDLERSDLNLYI